MAKRDNVPLKKWSQDSYDVNTGRSASSLEEAGEGSRGNHTTRVSRQLDACRGVEAMNKSGSHDAGRRKYGGSDLP